MKKIYLALKSFLKSLSIGYNIIDERPNMMGYNIPTLPPPPSSRSQRRYELANKITEEFKNRKRLATFDIMGLSVLQTEIILEGLMHLKSNVFNDNENFIAENKACNELYMAIDRELIKAKQ